MVSWQRILILAGKCRYVNGSSEPNAAFKIGKSWKLVAIRNIKAGEELTIKYQGVFG